MAPILISSVILRAQICFLFYFQEIETFYAQNDDLNKTVIGVLTLGPLNPRNICIKHE